MKYSIEDCLMRLRYAIDIDDSGLANFSYCTPAREDDCFVDEDGVLAGSSIFFAEQYLTDTEFRKLSAKHAFGYAHSAALLKAAKDTLAQKFGAEKVRHTRSAEERELDAKLQAPIKEWKEKNKGNEKYFTKRYVLKPATGFYSGKQGKEIARIARFDRLSQEELILIAKWSEGEKSKASKEVKKNNSGWLSQREDYTPDGWREYYKVKTNRQFELGIIGEEEKTKKFEWINTFDFHPGWNIKDEAKVIESIDGTLSAEGSSIMEEYCKAFCANAVAKAHLLRELNR